MWKVDLDSFRHEVVCRLPGYLRGLCFVGSVALIGLSTIREKHIFGGLPVQSQNPRLRCGVSVVEIHTGRDLGMFEFTEGCTELYDVGFLPGVLRPMILNAEKEATRQAVTTQEFSYWLRPSAVATDSPSGAVGFPHRGGRELRNRDTAWLHHVSVGSILFKVCRRSQSRKRQVQERLGLAARERPSLLAGAAGRGRVRARVTQTTATRPALEAAFERLCSRPLRREAAGITANLPSSVRPVPWRDLR